MIAASPRPPTATSPIGRSPLAADSSVRILSLAGGGFLGLFTVTVLAELEARAGEPLARRFDLLAGTSVGGILALALAYEVPMQTLVDLFHRDGASVFSPRPLPANPVARAIDLGRSVLGPKYDGVSLRRQLSAFFGRRTMAQALHRVVIPAVDVGRCLTKVFKTPHARACLGDDDLLAVDVAMATCAAPGFFPSVRVGEHLYADGGLFAVGPDQIALHEAEHFLGVSTERLGMLSVGTGCAFYQPASAPQADDGAVAWLRDGRLMLTLVSVQQQHVQAMLEDRLGQRYVRLDAAWPHRAGLGIDVATPKAARALTNLARQAIARIDSAELASLFGFPA